MVKLRLTVSVILMACVAIIASASEKVWVARADGGKSCSPNSGQSLDEAATDLRKAKVKILESKKASDGMMHTQMCGVPSGSTNSFLILKDDLPQAMAQGYVQVGK